MSVTLQGALAALNAAKEATRDNVVTSEVLQSRIAVCKACPQRRRITGTLSHVGNILARLANKHKVPKDISDFKCGVCSCPLSLLTTALPENLHVDSADEAVKRSKTKCWMQTP
jgi:hypothetical protein